MSNRLKRIWIPAVFVLAAVGLIGFLLHRQAAREQHAMAFYGMSTVIDQQAYGSSAEQAMQAVQQALADFESTLSLYQEDSEIARINAAAGKQPVAVSAETRALLTQAKAISLASDNAFALTIAPLSLAWGVTGDTPRVVPQAERETLLALVNDEDILIDDASGTVKLAHEGQALDLGGVAKGTACNLAREIYNTYHIDSALLSIGGNVYAHGTKPGGTAYRVGFRDPNRDASAAIASVELRNAVFAVSGGYERFFEQDGVRYHHILDPTTGAPAESDIVSVGVVDADGTRADFYSTTLFVWGKEKALAYFAQGGEGILLDNENRLYVSAGLAESFSLIETDYEVYFMENRT